MTLHEIGEDTIIKPRDGSRAKRIRQIFRITNKGYDQGTCLIIEDLSSILGSDEKIANNLGKHAPAFVYRWRK